MQSEIIDPIELLRDYMIQNEQDLQNGVPEEHQSRKVTREEETLVFQQFEGSGPGATIRLPLDTPTAWMSKDGKYYSLGSLWLLVANRHMGASEYIRTVHATQVKTPI